MRLRESLRKGMFMLGSMLVGKGLASEGQVEEALGEQARRKQRGSTHKRLGQLLIEMSAVSHDDLDQALTDQRNARERATTGAAEPPRVVGQAAEAITAMPQEIEAEVSASAPTVRDPAVARSESPPAPTAEASASPRFIASAKGVVFHTPDCLAAQKISATNRLEFDSEKAAEEAGKRSCAKCC